MYINIQIYIYIYMYVCLYVCIHMRVNVAREPNGEQDSASECFEAPK